MIYRFEKIDKTLKLSIVRPSPSYAHTHIYIYHVYIYVMCVRVCIYIYICHVIYCLRALFSLHVRAWRSVTCFWG